MSVLRLSLDWGILPGQLSVPMDELLCCLKDFSKIKKYYAYCRGPFCVLDDEAVKILSENRVLSQKA